MRILALSDIHGNRTALKRILAQAEPADVLIIAGDLTNWGDPDEALMIVALCEQHTPTVLTVSGNCDDDLIERHLVKHGSSLTGHGRAIAEVGFFGNSCGTPHLGNTWEVTEDVMEGWLTSGHQAVAHTPRKVLVTHSPPYGFVDLSMTKKRGGSHAVRAALDQYDIQLVICGHIHEARGQAQYNGTTIVNCGPVWMGFYAIVDLADAVTVEMRWLPMEKWW